MTATELLEQMRNQRAASAFRRFSALLRLADVDLGDSPAPLVDFYRSAQAHLTAGRGNA